MKAHPLRFGEALGNRFLLSDCRTFSSQEWRDLRDLVSQVDQIIEIHPSQCADWRLVFYNRDGSEAEACGNGTRCAALWLTEMTYQSNWKFETLGGILSVTVKDSDQITVTFPAPHLERLTNFIEEFPLLASPHIVSIGNPHLILWTEAHLDISLVGPKYETLFPQGINVSIASYRDEQTIDLKVWERGAGATAACGTAACATHASAFINGFVKPMSKVHQKGGILQIQWSEHQSPLQMSGPARLGSYL